jgi:hypothetical protein
LGHSDYRYRYGGCQVSILYLFTAIYLTIGFYSLFLFMIFISFIIRWLFLLTSDFSMVGFIGWLFSFLLWVTDYLFY